MILVFSKIIKWMRKLLLFFVNPRISLLTPLSLNSLTFVTLYNLTFSSLFPIFSHSNLDIWEETTQMKLVHTFYVINMCQCFGYMFNFNVWLREGSKIISLPLLFFLIAWILHFCVKIIISRMKNVSAGWKVKFSSLGMKILLFILLQLLFIPLTQNK